MEIVENIVKCGTIIIVDYSFYQKAAKFQNILFLGIGPGIGMVNGQGDTCIKLAILVLRYVPYVKIK